MSADVFVRNPHSILLALKKRPKEVLDITFPRDRLEGVWKEIEALVERHKIRTLQGSAPKPANKSNHKKDINAGRESGHGAMIKGKTSVSIEQMFDGVDGSTRGLWLALDCLQDPQNLGAIFRSAAFFGAKGIIMTTERSVPMTATVYDIACGGVEIVPFVQTINLKQALDKAKDSGMWILGTSEHAKQSLQKVEKDRPWLMVVGNEEKGMRRLTEEACDVICSIPNAGEGVGSLNVSVATGILLSHLS
jgi:23S rRNA (guanosine2251-2'-O)-methyltransferase